MRVLATLDDIVWGAWDVFPDEPFSRPAMWHHNYMPIQSVLFHRSLFEQHGGFAEDMDQLEDWNLWTRYECCKRKTELFLFAVP